MFEQVYIEQAIQSVIDKIGAEFPQAERMSQLARIIHEATFNHSEDIINNPDQKLLQWIDMEYELFRKIEEAKYGDQIRQGFDNVQDFIKFSNSVLNRRKSRAGKSLEYHLREIFDGNNLSYEWHAVTEGNKQPDFIFPSGAAYHNPSYDANNLIVLAAKTTCKDRWRQVLNEADRVRDKNKYLCTLQRGISIQQLQEMSAEKVVLVVPKPYIHEYPTEFRTKILSLSEFIELVKETVY